MCFVKQKNPTELNIFYKGANEKQVFNLKRPGSYTFLKFSFGCDIDVLFNDGSVKGHFWVIFVYFLLLL